VRWAEHGQAIGISLGHQLGGHQCGLDGLAHAHVVGDQQPHWVEAKGHQQRHKLVRAGIDGQLGD